MINLLWLSAILVTLGFGSVPGLLAIVAVFLMEAVLELKAIRARLATATLPIETHVEVTLDGRVLARSVSDNVLADMSRQRSKGVH